MFYVSTRDNGLRLSASQAILAGLAPDGGLFLPESLPSFSSADLAAWTPLTYQQRAAAVLERFLSDYTAQELDEYTQKAYGSNRFASEQVAPLVKLKGNAYVLELFHGPTCAFKDFALQILPYLLTAAMRKNNIKEEVVILTATSGDTGKAALEGFADVAGAKICVFFPHGGTSMIQKLQMTTQSGSNVMVAAVRGNFDDTQTGVKNIFTDSDYAADLARRGYMLSSANSINWGRLAPQIAYYVSAYCDLLRRGDITNGQLINICVPTGNFGNILAAYIAKQCGLPVDRLICASNKNNVLTDFIADGVYNSKRPFHLTSSPSMDILISSNLERLLYLLADRDDAQTAAYMRQLKQDGRYQVSSEILGRLQAEFSAGWCSEEVTLCTIRNTFEQQHYLCDTHTAVGIKVYEDYLAQTHDDKPCVIAATADPFKFCGSVLPALGIAPDSDCFAQLRELEAICGSKAPSALAGLASREERFTQVVATDGMRGIVEQLL